MPFALILDCSLRLKLFMHSVGVALEGTAEGMGCICLNFEFQSSWFFCREVFRYYYSPICHVKVELRMRYRGQASLLLIGLQSQVLSLLLSLFFLLTYFLARYSSQGFWHHSNPETLGPIWNSVLVFILFIFWHNYYCYLCRAESSNNISIP